MELSDNDDKKPSHKILKHIGCGEENTKWTQTVHIVYNVRFNVFM